MLSLRVSLSKLRSALLGLLKTLNRNHFSIINERKTHSNFQLIIITHDENFLRKLGQSDVMEYYWLVLLSIISHNINLISHRQARFSGLKAKVRHRETTI